MIKRLHWVDVAKCFGIFAIYLGHCGVAAGNAYEFVFSHHIPLFFLLSGCMEAKREALPVHKIVIRTVKQILIPWLLFSIVSIVVSVLLFNEQYNSVVSMLIAVAKGTIRSGFIAGSLWFLPCLAVVQILFGILRKLKYKVPILCLCAASLWLTQYVLQPNPLISPSWLFNVDSALYYIFYYAVGYISFPFVCKALEPKNVGGKILLSVSGAAAFVYSGLIFFGKNLLGFMEQLPYIGAFSPVMTALIIIWFYFVVARIFQNVDIFRRIGGNTLYLCGSEFLIGSIFQQCIAMLGLGLSLTTPLTSFCYVAVLLVLANQFLVPVEKRLIKAVWAIPEYFKNNKH